jgi:hypothetical protein
MFANILQYLSAQRPQTLGGFVGLPPARRPTGSISPPVTDIAPLLYTFAVRNAMDFEQTYPICYCCGVIVQIVERMF